MRRTNRQLEACNRSIARPNLFNARARMRSAGIMASGALYANDRWGISLAICLPAVSRVFRESNSRYSLSIETPRDRAPRSFGCRKWLEFPNCRKSKQTERELKLMQSTNANCEMIGEVFTSLVSFLTSSAASFEIAAICKPPDLQTERRLQMFGQTVSGSLEAISFSLSLSLRRSEGAKDASLMRVHIVSKPL